MKIAFAKSELPSAGTIVVGVLEEHRLTPTAQQLDKLTKGAIGRALGVGRFKGRPDEQLAILAPPGIDAARILLIGLGKADALDAATLLAIGGRIAAALNAAGEHAGGRGGGRDRRRTDRHRRDGRPSGPGRAAARLSLRQIPDTREARAEADAEAPHASCWTITAAAKKAFDPLEKIADGVTLTRDLVSEPANVIYPETLAERAKKLADLGVEVEVLGEKQMKKLGMGALLGVGQGIGARIPARDHAVARRRRRQAAAHRLRRQGRHLRHRRHLDQAGRGHGRHEVGHGRRRRGDRRSCMRWPARKAKVNVVGIVAAGREHALGHRAAPGRHRDLACPARPSKCINTDAEGRLVLADALWYCQEQFKPQAMIDLATLTGAIIVALGNVHGGLFSNNDTLAERLAAAGKATGELLWRMPLADAYDKQINSDAADMKNVGGRNGGSITAAQFLQRFIKDTPWAHLDIAGMAWSDKDAPTVPKGATAFGVRLLERLVADHYEER